MWKGNQFAGKVVGYFGVGKSGCLFDSCCTRGGYLGFHVKLHTHGFGTGRPGLVLRLTRPCLHYFTGQPYFLRLGADYRATGSIPPFLTSRISRNIGLDFTDSSLEGIFLSRRIPSA